MWGQPLGARLPARAAVPHAQLQCNFSSCTGGSGEASLCDPVYQPAGGTGVRNEGNVIE